jgi:hypothetical protein
MEEVVHAGLGNLREAPTPFSRSFLLTFFSFHTCSGWFSVQYPRWMDVLIYSGQELFILDGDALLQFVLDDELLAFAKKGDPSLQLLHATWILEKTVEELLKKDCTFEIVFFESEFAFFPFPR